MTSSRKRISRGRAFEILRMWHKNRELLLLETFSKADKQRRAFFVTTTEIDEGKPGILVTVARSPFSDIKIKTEGVEFFELSPTDKYPTRLLIVTGDDETELSEVGEA